MVSSPNDRKLVMVELTVPWETRCDKAQYGQVHWTTRTVQEAWLEYLAVSRGDRMQRIPSRICMENARQTGNQGRRQKEGCMETTTSSRESVQLVVYEELVANHWSIVSDQPWVCMGLSDKTLDEGSAQLMSQWLLQLRRYFTHWSTNGSFNMTLQRF